MGDLEKEEKGDLDVEFLKQLVDSMSEAVSQLEKVKEGGKIEDSKKIKDFILKVQKKISEELA